MHFFKKLRQDFITELIETYGYINRSNICKEFGVSIPTASSDLRKWMEMNPGKIVYNLREKRYELIENKLKELGV